MDIQFLTIIFLVAARMEMIAKMMRKAREREIKGEESAEAGGSPDSGRGGWPAPDQLAKSGEGRVP